MVRPRDITEVSDEAIAETGAPFIAPSMHDQFRAAVQERLSAYKGEDVAIELSIWRQNTDDMRGYALRINVSDFTMEKLDKVLLVMSHNPVGEDGEGNRSNVHEGS